jgi:hypothetical protein
VTAVINTIVNPGQQADFAMPVSGRVRISSLRALPLSGEKSVLAGHVCALVGDVRVVDGVVGGYRSAIAFDTTGAFPGPSAWSPPI